MNKENLDKKIINYKEGIARFSDSEKLYEKYLLKFIADTHMENVRNAFQEKDYQTMLEQLHPLKGMAGTLGLKGLYASCDEGVKRLRNQQWEELEECMSNIEKEYCLVIKLLQEAFEG